MCYLKSDEFYFLNILSASNIAMLCSADLSYYICYSVLLKIFRWLRAAHTFFMNYVQPWYDMIWYDVIYLLTAIVLTLGSSSTVHIYTQTITQNNKTKQNTQKLLLWFNYAKSQLTSHRRFLRTMPGTNACKKSQVSISAKGTDLSDFPSIFLCL